MITGGGYDGWLPLEYLINKHMSGSSREGSDIIAGCLTFMTATVTKLSDVLLVSVVTR